MLPIEAFTRIVLAESLAGAGGRLPLGDALQSGSSRGEVALAVGPEGGWADEELGWLCETGWVAASLGTTILRAETAAIVATAIALEALR